MKKTRKNVFDTNSSSTHSFVIAQMDDEEVMRDLELRISKAKDELVKLEETTEELKLRGVWDYETS